MGPIYSMHGTIKNKYDAEKDDIAKRIASKLVSESLAHGLALAGGAAGLFDTLKNPGVVVPDSPLYWLIDGASILNFPAKGDPNVSAGANGGPKPDRTQALFTYAAERLQALWQWVYTNGATFAGALYAVFNALPLVQVGLGLMTSSC